MDSLELESANAALPVRWFEGAAPLYLRSIGKGGKTGRHGNAVSICPPHARFVDLGVVRRAVSSCPLKKAKNYISLRHIREAVPRFLRIGCVSLVCRRIPL
jgi:hypothetical protein